MTTLIDIDNRAANGLRTDRLPADVQFAADRSRSSAGRRAEADYSAPKRFDVHHVAAFEQWVTESIVGGASTLVIDASRIDFVDMAAIEAIERVRETHSLNVVDPSPATLITFRLLGMAIQAMALGEAA